MKAPRLNPFPGIIFGLIGMNMVIVAITVYCATSDKSFAVEPQYYQKAIAWNQTAHQRQHNADLGWSLNLAVTPIPSAPTSPSRTLTVTLRDKSGNPIPNAHIDCTAFSYTDAAHRHDLQLPQRTPGTYSDILPADRAGLWEFRFTITAAGQTFTSTLSRDLSAPAVTR